jgi:hypothetical protein
MVAMQNQPVPSPAPTAARARDKRLGLALIAGAFVLSLGISLWAKRASGPELGKAPAPATTVGIYGWPKQVDAMKTLPVARALTPRNLLRGIVLERSKNDGTVDVTDGGEVRFHFQSAAGQGPQPPRKPGVVPRRNNCGRQTVQILPNGIVADADQPGVPCPLAAADSLPEPRCTPAKVWSAALQRGAPANGRARIEYYRSVAGPAWRFETSTGMRLHLYGDCERELARHESVAANP